MIKRIVESRAMHSFRFVGLCLSAIAVLAQPALAQRPNIVLINLDDADIDLLNDNSLERFFPNFDQLRREGMRFSNFHVTSPLCGPSRMCLLRGQYAHQTGFRTNSGNDSSSRGFEGGYEYAVQQKLLNQQLGVWMDDAGYRTMFVGKFLNNGFVPEVPPGWDDFSASLQASYYGVRQFHNLRAGKGEYESRPDFEYRVDTEVDQMMTMLQRQFNHRPNQPFFLYYAPFTPHLPGTGDSADMPEPRYASYWRWLKQPTDIAYDEADVSDKPSFYQLLARLSQPTMSKLQDQYRDRVRATRSVDKALGRLMNRLAADDKLNNTFIVVTSDNGFLMGEHRLWAKKVPFDRSSRVPLIIWGPTVPPLSECQELVAHIDLAPTFVELAKGTTPKFVSGQSFLPLWFDPQSTERAWRGSLLVENWSEKRVGNEIIPTTYTSLRLVDSIYTEWSNGEIEYYDLQQDPYQVENSASTISTYERELLSTLLKIERDPSAASVLTVEAPSGNKVGLGFELKGVAEASAGVNKVVVSVMSLDRRTYWNGSGWQDKPFWHSAELAGKGQVLSDWRLAVDLNLPKPASEKLKLRIKGYDLAGGKLPLIKQVRQLDGVRPSVEILQPKSGKTSSNKVQIEAQCRDNNRIRVVRFQLYDKDRKRYWTGSKWQSSSTSFRADQAGDDVWQEAVKCGKGKYRVKVWAIDDRGNRSGATPTVNLEVK